MSCVWYVPFDDDRHVARFARVAVPTDPGRFLSYSVEGQAQLPPGHAAPARCRRKAFQVRNEFFFFLTNLAAVFVERD